MNEKQSLSSCTRCKKETSNPELCQDCFQELFIPSEEEFANAFIMESAVGAADNERRKQAVIEYLTAHPNSVFNDSFYYPPQDIKKKLILRCDRCNQEIKPARVDKHSITLSNPPCPCRELEIERLNKLHGDYTIDSISVHEILPDGTKGEELVSWNGDKDES